MLAQQNIIFIVGMAIPAIAILIVGVSFLRIFRCWLQAKLAGVPLSPAEIYRVVLRRCDPKVVVETLIMARQAGVKLSCTEVEAAYLAGADLRKISAAFLKAKSEGIDVSFEDLVETDLRDSDRQLRESGLQPPTR